MDQTSDRTKRHRWRIAILPFLCLLLLSTSPPIEADTKDHKKGDILKVGQDNIPLETYMGTKTHTLKKQTVVKTKTRKKKAKKTETKSHKQTRWVEQNRWKDDERQIVRTYKIIETKTYLKKNKKTYKVKKTVTEKERIRRIKLYSGDIDPDRTAAKKNPPWLNQAFKDMNYRFTLDPRFKNYPDYNNPKDRYVGLFSSNYGITVRDTNPETVYHEFGHFLALLAGGIYDHPDLKAAFDTERNIPTFGNASYGKTKINEYFACSYANYIIRPKELKKATPKTYAFIEYALHKGKIKAEILTTSRLKETIRQEDRRTSDN